MNDVEVTTKTIIGEARGEEYDGQLAVALVIRNRARNPRWWGGPSWESVCLKPWQFSCWNDAANQGQAFLNTLTMADITGGREYRSCLRAALYAYDLAPRDITQGATHYVVTSWLDNPSLRPTWADTLEPTVVIGNHSFFRAAQ